LRHNGATVANRRDRLQTRGAIAYAIKKKTAVKEKAHFGSLLLAALISHGTLAHAAAVHISARDIGGVVRRSWLSSTVS
jgi:hypothetical protein